MVAPHSIQPWVVPDTARRESWRRTHSMMMYVRVLRRIAFLSLYRDAFLESIVFSGSFSSSGHRFVAVISEKMVPQGFC